MPRAFVYIRVSSQEQAKHDRYSLPEQQRRLREFCEQKGYTVAALYQDVQSGKRDDRKQYQAMLAALRQKQAERVVVFLLDRFGRNTREILTRVWELQDLGVTVEASDEDISHELIRLIMAWRAGDESERIAKRVKPSLEARAALGKWNGTPAFGLTIGKDGKLAIDPADNCRAVDLAFEWYDPAGSERLSLNAICRRLKALGYKQPWGGTDWHSGTLYRLLTCRAYVGDFLRNGQEIMDNHPARIDRAVFERVQARLTLRKHNQTSVSERPDRLGAGLVYCACGYPMRYSLGVTMSQKGRHYGYWSCNRRRIVGDCQARGFSELALARVLRSRLAALRLPTPEEVVHRAAELRQPTAPCSCRARTDRRNDCRPGKA